MAVDQEDSGENTKEETRASATNGPQWLNDLKISLGLLTRVPTFVPSFNKPVPEPLVPGRIAAASRFFPVIGVGVGIIGAIVLAIATFLDLPATVSALLALVAMTMVTGALHEDGLADCCDGFFGAGSRADVLRIMRDSRIGAFGVLGLVFVVGLRWAGLAAVTDESIAAAAMALIAAAGLSRALLPAVMHAVPNAREDGLSAGAGRPDFTTVVWAGSIGLAVALIGLGFAAGLLATALAAAAGAGLAAYALKRIDGQTGDVLGATQQIGETTILLVAAATL